MPSIDGFKNPCSSSTALETRFAMRCDRAECLTEASTGSITDEADQTKSTDYADYREERTRTGHKKAQKAQTISEDLFVLLVPFCGLFCVISEICGFG